MSSCRRCLDILKIRSNFSVAFIHFFSLQKMLAPWFQLILFGGCTTILSQQFRLTLKKPCTFQKIMSTWEGFFRWFGCHLPPKQNHAQFIDTKLFIHSLWCRPFSPLQKSVSLEWHFWVKFYFSLQYQCKTVIFLSGKDEKLQIFRHWKKLLARVKNIPMKKVCLVCVLSCVLKTTLQGQPLLNWTKQTHSRWTSTLFFIFTSLSCCCCTGLPLKERDTHHRK